MIRSSAILARLVRNLARRQIFTLCSVEMGVQAIKVKAHGLRTLIVDDEPVARQVLREQLEAFPEVQVIGEASDGQDALRKIQIEAPELVFLDLQMPLMGGFEVVRALGLAPVPLIVIVTAYDEYAIGAFESGAVDYLLKPVSQDRLRKAVERAARLRSRPDEASGPAATTASVEARPGGRKIVGRGAGEYLLLDADEVIAFQAEAELVWIVTATQRLLADQPLWAIARRFAGSEFQRVHRNAIVNTNHIKKLTALTSHRWLITLSNSLQVVVSKRQAGSIRKLLHW